VIVINRILVVHVILQLTTGGMEKLLVEFAKHVDRRRFDLHFVSLTTKGAVAEELEREGWPITALNVPAGLRPELVFRLASLFRRWKPNIIHVHNSKPLIYAGPSARMARVPCLVYTRHGQRRGATRRQTFLLKAASRCANALVCVSRDAAEQCISEGFPRHKIRTILNGIDLAQFPEIGPTPGAPFVMIGRLSPEKGVDTLLDAVAIVRSQEPTFRLRIAGDGPCFAQLQQKAVAHSFGQAVEFLGRVTDVAGLLQSSGGCILSSLTEGLSLTLLEAMSSGLPVIATRVGGNLEVVADGLTGLLVPPKHPRQLAEAILGLWRDPIRAQQMGTAGRARVEQHFDARHMVNAYEELYGEFISASTRELAIQTIPLDTARMD
jgi:glycosyltransferase involved in cell wall biosynthesis